MSHEMRVAVRKQKGRALASRYVAGKKAKAASELSLVREILGDEAAEAVAAAQQEELSAAELTAAKWAKRRYSRNPFMRMAAAIRL